MKFLLLTFIIGIQQGAKPLPEPSVEEIYNRYVEAQGGLELWKELRSYSRESYRKSGLKTKVYAKKPDSFQFVFRRDDQTFVKSYDGNHGWILNNGVYEPMRPGEAIEMAEEPEFYEDLLNAREKGHVLELEGKETVGDALCYKVRMTKSATDEQWYWINTETYVLEMVGEYSEDPAHDGIFYTTRFEDYRKIKGYNIPFTEHLIRNGTDTTSIYYTSMEINPEIRDSVFRYVPDNTSNLFRWMKDKYKHHPTGYSFKQETIRYSDLGKTKDTSTWYETIVYPDKFRIDFGDPKEKNANVYVRDSVFIFRQGHLSNQAPHIHDFLLFEGGYRHLTNDSILGKLRLLSIDPDKFRIVQEDSKQYALVGANPGEDTVAQVWLELESGLIHKTIGSLGEQGMYSAIVTEHSDVEGYTFPLKIEFYLYGYLLQEERYYDIRLDRTIPKDFFNSRKLGNTHWLDSE